jgi:hypothetical protein
MNADFADREEKKSAFFSVNQRPRVDINPPLQMQI